MNVVSHPDTLDHFTNPERHDPKQVRCPECGGPSQPFQRDFCAWCGFALAPTPTTTMVPGRSWGMGYITTDERRNLRRKT